MIQEVFACLNCKNPMCEKACPLHNHIRDFIFSLKNNDLKEAQAILYQENPFAAITCRICNHAGQCMGHCVKGIKGEAVAIAEIEKYISQDLKLDLTCKPSNGKKIALVGAGVANLTLAYYLAKEGYAISIYEKENYLGGTIVSGIPEFRFEHAILDQLIKEIQQLPIQFFVKTTIGQDLSLNDLQKEYDAVILGVGAMAENRMSFKNAEYAYSGIELLKDLNIHQNSEKYKKYKNALVIGGGNVAIDCARSLKRLLNTTLMYRRSEKEMPASKSEILEAKAENIRFEFLANIKEIIVEDHQVVAAKCIKMELGEKDASGRASFKEIEDSLYLEDVDLIVMAIGQRVDLSCIDQNLEVLDNHHTNFEHVYVVGDAYLGPRSVSHAIGDAKEVLKLIEEEI